MNSEQKYYEQFEAVLDDLQQFLQQKRNQQLIFAILQIKKAARRQRPTQISKISVRQGSNRLSSSRKSQISSQSISLSRSKQSHISYDIIKGSQTLNQIRLKGFDQIYTQTIINPTQNDQPNDIDVHQVSFNQDSIVKNQKVPRLIGFVSSQEISDIEPLRHDNSIHKHNRVYIQHNQNNQHYKYNPNDLNSQHSHHKQHNSNNQHNQHRTHNQYKNTINEYQRSIVQEDDDQDDQFEDIVLNRLDQIQAKVTQMLRQKKRANRPLSQLIAYKPLTKLSNISSGSQINNHRAPRVGDYYRPQESNNKSTAMISHKNQQNYKSKNISTHSYQKKEPSAKLASFVQRLNIPIRSQAYQKLQTQYNEYSSIPHEKLGQYSSSKSVRQWQYPGQMRCQTQPYQQDQPGQKISRKSKQSQFHLNYHNITMQNSPSTNNYRYIPLSKLNLSIQNKNQLANKHIQRENRRHQDSQSYIQFNKQSNRQSKRQFNRQRQTQRHPSRNSQHQSSFNYSNHRQLDHKDKQYQRQHQQWQNDHLYLQKRSQQDSGVRRIKDSKGKAYSQHPDYIETQEQAQISFINNNNVYRDIRQLREITKKHVQQRRQPNSRQQTPYLKQNQQKTQRTKYHPSHPPHQISYHQQISYQLPLQSHQYQRYIEEPIYINQHQQYIPRQYIASDYQGDRKNSYKGDNQSIRNLSSKSSANFNVLNQRVKGNIAGQSYKEKSLQYNTNTKNHTNSKYYGQAQKSHY